MENKFNLGDKVYIVVRKTGGGNYNHNELMIPAEIIKVNKSSYTCLFDKEWEQKWGGINFRYVGEDKCWKTIKEKNLINQSSHNQ